MKIMMLIDQVAAGGAEKVFLKLASMLSTDNDVIVVAFNKKSEAKLQSDGSFILEYYSRNTGSPKIIKFIKDLFGINKKLRNFEPDIVISFLERSNIISIICSKLNHTPVVISVRNNILEQYRLKRFFEKFSIFFLIKFLYNYADRIISLSYGIENMLIKYYGISEGKILTIYNTYDANDLVPAANNVSESTNFVAVGRLETQKDFNFLIDAFCEYKLSGGKSKLEIYGDGPLKSILINKIQATGMAEHIRICSYEQKILQYHTTAKALLLTSKYEGFCNVVAEAQLLGVPVITLDVAYGPKEILSYGEKWYPTESPGVLYNKRGILVESRSVHSFASALHFCGKIWFDNQEIQAVSIEQLCKDETLSLWNEVIRNSVAKAKL